MTEIGTPAKTTGQEMTAKSPIADGLLSMEPAITSLTFWGDSDAERISQMCLRHFIESELATPL